jgi:hypothetical protein
MCPSERCVPAPQDPTPNIKSLIPQFGAVFPMCPTGTHRAVKRTYDSRPPPSGEQKGTASLSRIKAVVGPQKNQSFNDSVVSVFRRAE